MEGNRPGIASAATLLTCQMDALQQDEDWTLAHFTFVADATTLSGECDLVCSPAMSVANFHGQRFPKLAFLGEDPRLLANYTIFLVEPGSEVHVLVGSEQRPIVEAAFEVLDVRPYWQLVYKGELTSLDPGPTADLKPKHLPAMQALAQKANISTIGEELLKHGPAVGIWEGRTLAAMGLTRTRIQNIVEIGKIAVHPEYKEKGYVKPIVAALIHALAAEDPVTIFTMVAQSNIETIETYESLGFVRARPMFLIRCLVAGEPEKQ